MPSQFWSGAMKMGAGMEALCSLRNCSSCCPSACDTHNARTALGKDKVRATREEGMAEVEARGTDPAPGLLEDVVGRVSKTARSINAQSRTCKTLPAQPQHAS